MEPQLTTEQTTTTPVTPTPAPQPEPRSTRRRVYIVGGVILLLILLALGYVAYSRMSANVAAVVNGTRISKAEVEENVEMLRKSAELQGIDVADPAVMSEVQAQALENLINNELLLGAARKSGLSTNEAAVQTAYDALVEEVGGEAELKSRMDTIGLTPDSLRGNISDRLVVDQYIESVTDIENVSVTEEEIAAYMESMAAEGITLPPPEEIRSQLEASILSEKQQTIVNNLIAQLRSEAVIEIR